MCFIRLEGGGGGVVVFDLVDVIRGDLREVVGYEVRRFLLMYEGCEVVDAIYDCCPGMSVRRAVVVEGMPCDIRTFFVFTSGGVVEVENVKCVVMLEDVVLAVMEVVRFLHKCFVKVQVNEEGVNEMAGNIVREVVGGVEGGG